MVHEDAGELTAYRLGQQSCSYGGVHTARQSQQDLTVSDLFPNGGDGRAAIVAHGPVALSVADGIEEVADHAQAVFRVVDLWMILHAVETADFISNGSVGAHVRVPHQGETVGHLGHVVPVAHPGDALLRQVLEEATGGIVVGDGLSVLAGGVLLGGGDETAQVMGHQLATIADTQNGHAPGEDLRVDLGGGVQIDAVGPTGENNADGIHGFQLRQGGGVGLYLAVNAAFPHPAGDELVVLAAEVQHEDKFMVHERPSFLSVPAMQKYRYFLIHRKISYRFIVPRTVRKNKP